MVSITLVALVHYSECMQLFNVIFRRLLRALDLKQVWSGGEGEPLVWWGGGAAGLVEREGELVVWWRGGGAVVWWGGGAGGLVGRRGLVIWWGGIGNLVGGY